MGTAQATGLEVVLEGTAFERGVQHGRLLGEPIRHFLADNLAQINSLRSRPLDADKLPALVLPYRQVIAQYLPEIMEELEGLAQGAGIQTDEAVLLQVRRELIGTGSFTLLGDCSSLARYTQEEVVLAQTIDLNGNMTDIGRVFRIIPENKKKPEILMYSFAGLLGYMGMNSAGLAVTINLVVSGGWKAGIPPYLLVRKFLECSTIEECLQVVETIPVASSRSFTITDRRRQVILEITPETYRVTEGDQLLHTNHFLHPELKSEDRMNIFSKNSSAKRLALLGKKLGNDWSLQNIQAAFADHTLHPVGICAHNESNIKLNETVAAVIMYPRQGAFRALKGKACTEKYQLFNLPINNNE
ncbi:C45 family peptidase [Chitinophaga sp. GbtcB8]|uniref:C45 family autoproteolytic acyltransferase/hydolase n=1 Tax=Chitinophaga sp. GbtcB8 TaxID=2824753 RepID=UPI001C2FF81E|nr:C45 family peptidase [Chitinophaga sp. GbtcB8]